MEDFRYPIGKYARPDSVSEQDRVEYISRVAAIPMKLRNAVNGLSDEQLNTPYREGGWTVRQVVHHLSDSHLNAFIRFKLALTENEPTIKPYMEGEWAKLPDYTMPVDSSLAIIDGIHEKWVYLLKKMTSGDFEKSFMHPEQKRLSSLANTLSLYAWHGDHHLAHITELKKRKGW